MKYPATFYGKFEKASPMGIAFNADERAAFNKICELFENKRAKVTIQEETKTRSNPQNAWYWSIIVPLIGDSIGEDDPASVHGWLKSEFNYEMKFSGDQEFRIPRSTAKLTTAEFSDYCARIQRWAAEFLGIYIPDPNEGDPTKEEKDYGKSE